MSVDFSYKSKKSVSRRIVDNTGILIGAKITGVIFGIGTLYIAANVLGSNFFGVVVFMHGYMLFFSEVATFQTWQSIIRFGTDDVEHKDIEKFSNLIKFSIKLEFLASILAYIMAVSLFGVVTLLMAQFPGLAPSSEGLDFETLRNYTLIYSTLVIFKQVSTAIGLFRLFDKFMIVAVNGLVMPVCRFFGSLYAAYAGWGLEGFLLVWYGASLINFLVQIFMGVRELTIRRLLKPVIKAKGSFRNARAGLWPFVIKSNIDSTIGAGHLHMPVLLVTAIFGTAFAGVYKIAEEVAKILSEGFKLLDQVIYPELAKLVVSGKSSKIWRLVIRAGIIMLCIGLVFSTLLLLYGAPLLSRVLDTDFATAAPLASLLIPAAAMTGIIAPLYPVFYAAGQPGKAIIARGLSLVIYVAAFLVLSFTIGEMAPGWALLLANIFAVIFVIFTARKTLKTMTLSKSEKAKTMEGKKRISFMGKTHRKIWGLPIQEWQIRAFKKVGVKRVAPNDAHLFLDVNWIMSSSLIKGFTERSQKFALLVEGEVIGAGGVSYDDAKALLGLSRAELQDKYPNILILTPDELSSSYNKMLRKKNTPYALDSRVVPLDTIMKKQFQGSYKGITDFVTKFFWPLPAYYVTRLCAHLRLSPNMVTTVSLILMLLALYYFAQGQWILGFVTGWAMTFLDTVDGKLARTTMTYSAWGNIYDHGIDLIHPPFWYCAWFVGLGGSFYEPNLLFWALVAIGVGYVVDRIVEGVFILRHGFHIHVWRPVNSALRFIIARRNPNMFIFMIGIMLSGFIPEAAIMGFYLVAIWTWTCIMFNIGVIIVAEFKKKPLNSWMQAGPLSGSVSGPL